MDILNSLPMLVNPTFLATQGILLTFYGTYALLQEVVLDMKGLNKGIISQVPLSKKIKHIRLEPQKGGGNKRVYLLKKEWRLLYWLILLISGATLQIASYLV